MTRKSTLMAATAVLALGILQSPVAVMAHGHGGNNHSHDNEANNNNHDHGDNYDSNYEYDPGELWSGPSMTEVIVLGGNRNSDPCTDLNYRLDYPGKCEDQ